MPNIENLDEKEKNQLKDKEVGAKELINFILNNDVKKIRETVYYKEQALLDKIQFMFRGKQVFYNAIQLICIESHKKTLEFILKESRQVSQLLDTRNEDNNSLLHLMLSYEVKDMLKLLLSYDNLLLEKTNSQGQTPLCYAAAINSSPKFIEHLIGLKAKTHSPDAKKMTPLHYAINSSNPAQVKLFLDNKDTIIDYQNIDDYTPLHLAIQQPANMFDTIKRLLSMGVLVNIFSSLDGHSPLTLAAALNKQGNKDAIIYRLLRNKAKIDHSDRNGRTALHHSIMNMNFSLAIELINLGANVNIQDIDGQTPLHLAVIHDSSKVLQWLLEHGSILDATNKLKQTPLIAAILANNTIAVFNLLKAGADINHVNSDGKTPLHHAAEAGDFSSVEALLVYGADPNAIDRDQRTPLHLVLPNYKADMPPSQKDKYFNTVNRLIEAFARDDVLDKEGSTPYDLTGGEEAQLATIIKPKINEIRAAEKKLSFYLSVQERIKAQLTAQVDDLRDRILSIEAELAVAQANHNSAEIKLSALEKIKGELTSDTLKTRSKIAVVTQNLVPQFEKAITRQLQDPAPNTNQISYLFKEFVKSLRTNLRVFEQVSEPSLPSPRLLSSLLDTSSIFIIPGNQPRQPEPEKPAKSPATPYIAP